MKNKFRNKPNDRPVENQALNRVDKKKTGKALAGVPVSALKPRKRGLHG